MRLKKYWMFVFAALVLAALILFFPMKTVHVFTAEADQLNSQKEKTGQANLSVQIEEIRSCCFRYKTQFAFQLDDAVFDTIERKDYKKIGNTIFLHQMFFEEEYDAFSLIYPQDFSYVALIAYENCYVIRNMGCYIEYADIPWLYVDMPQIEITSES